MLNRNKKLNKLIELLNGMSGNKIISIDGNWGCGKTFFLKQLEFINKKNFTFNDKINEKNANKFKNNYDVYYYNAWENDMHESPLLSLIYNLINDFPEEKKQTASGKVELPFNMIDCLNTLTLNFVDIKKVKTYQDLTAEIHTSEEKKKALNNIIESILPVDKKLIFIVDELDRCKPDYALKMLEVIKHFYLNENIIFLLGTNNLQLSYMISNYYGSDFDGYGYLNKIYNLIIELGNVSPAGYIENVLGRKNLNGWIETVMYGVCDNFNFSMREINRLLNDYDILDDYMKTNYGGFFSEDLVVKYLFFPYCLGLKIVNGIELSNFFAGKGYSALKEFIFTNNEIKEILKNCYNSKKTNIDSEKEEELLEIYLKEKYDSYFLNKITEWEIKENKEKFLDIFSLLSNYSKITME